jgi:hypothetical protein
LQDDHAQCLSKANKIGCYGTANGDYFLTERQARRSVQSQREQVQYHMDKLRETTDEKMAALKREMDAVKDPKRVDNSACGTQRFSEFYEGDI